MRYSLVNRVRGTFLGALLGESLTTQNPCDLGEVAILGSKSLITLGKLDINDLLNSYQSYQKTFLDLSTDHVSGGKNREKLILATLPVAIFFHENPVKLKENLLQLAKIGDHSPVVQDAILSIGYAIAQSFTETVNPLTLIPQIVDFLGETTTSSIPQKLSKVNILLQQEVGLEQVRNEFNKQEKLSNDVALAFYCFLSTLEDFRLSVLRANHNSFEPNFLCCALTGALSGAYNSTVGIPGNWQFLLSSTNPPVWGMDSVSQMLKLADDLVAVWSGVYHITPHKDLTKPEDDINFRLAPLSLFAAPHVIRPR